MNDKLNIPDTEKKDIPETPEDRIRELMELPLKDKENFIPPVGQFVKLGPFIYQVKVTNPGQMRFTASLYDVVIEGVNDGSEKVSDIVDPNTGKGVVKDA